jgi:hypothetical protein
MPSSTLMMVLLLVASFYDIDLSLQFAVCSLQFAVCSLQFTIEDYVHSAREVPALVIMRLGCLALAAVFFVLRIAVRGWWIAGIEPGTDRRRREQRWPQLPIQVHKSIEEHSG